MADLQRIQNCINEIPALIKEVEELQPVSSGVVRGYMAGETYSAEDINNLKEKIEIWKVRTTEIVAHEVGDSDPYLFQFSSRWRAPLRGMTFKGGMKHKLQNARSDLRILLTAAGERTESTASSGPRPPKVFISHKTEDLPYATALVNLINFIIGADGDKIFCSSIAGYGVKPSQDIIDKIKEQFTNHNLFVVIIHSPRYYKSSVCLNEMGAAWALDTKFYSFLTKDCRIDQLTGVIGNEEMCISPNADEEMLNAHLNSFKEDLVAFFGASPIDQSKWEHERKQFVEAIAAIKDAETPGETNDLFDTVYLPTFDTIFDILDADHFHDWAYLCALDGNTILTKRASDAINRVIAYVRSRPKHKEYASWDSLIQNLGLLLSDFKTVFACHSDNMGPDAYTVERFYKYGPMGQSYNPNYDEDLKAYNEHVFLISDLLFELARLGNLILSRIRAIHPEYKRELGILYIDDRVNTPDLVYREEEISDSPYPGIKDFISVRLSREKHLGTSGTIDEDGYEKEYKKSLFAK
jgi:hypothetical protein